VFVVHVAAVNAADKLVSGYGISGHQSNVNAKHESGAAL
jgi:hypothetical protein